MTPIENWLELEFGITAVGKTGEHELSADLLFKKPFQLSRTAEFMFGAGPEMVRRSTASGRHTALGAEVVADFMFWPSARLGWYVEPGYERTFGKNGESGVGVTGGILIAWP
jgi:hypothetical protein